MTNHRHACTPSLSDDDAARLEALLAEHRAAGTGCMGIDGAHGFLTAVVSGPRLILPMEWLPRILGGAAAVGQFAEANELLSAMYRDVLHELDHGHFGPLIVHRAGDSGDPPLPLPYGWCQGYAVGLSLHGEGAIDAAGADPVARGHLECIAAFLVADEAERFDPHDPDAQREAAGRLAAAATALYRWWRDDRASPAGSLRP